MSTKATTLGDIAKGAKRRVIVVSPGFGGLYRLLYALPGGPAEYLSLAPGETLKIGQAVRIFEIPDPGEGEPRRVMADGIYPVCDGSYILA